MPTIAPPCSAVAVPSRVACRPQSPAGLPVLRALLLPRPLSRAPALTCAAHGSRAPSTAAFRSRAELPSPRAPCSRRAPHPSPPSVAHRSAAAAAHDSLAPRCPCFRSAAATPQVSLRPTAAARRPIPSTTAPASSCSSAPPGPVPATGRLPRPCLRPPARARGLLPLLAATPADSARATAQPPGPASTARPP
nr:vegetative cell wall protein gp1-like [Aegilops tauschii subsp. strangulata]